MSLAWYLTSYPLGPVNVASFGNSIFEDAIELKRLTGVGWVREYLEIASLKM